LTAAVRDGVEIERPGRENAPQGRTRECDQSPEIAADRMHFPIPVPARCREPGNGNWEVGALTALTALAPVLL
jgi:hypothetical protein